MDGGLLAKFDADAEYLDEDMDFTFEEFRDARNLQPFGRYAVSRAPRPYFGRGRGLFSYQNIGGKNNEPVRFFG